MVAKKKIKNKKMRLCQGADFCKTLPLHRKFSRKKKSPSRWRKRIRHHKGTKQFQPFPQLPTPHLMMCLLLHELINKTVLITSADCRIENDLSRVPQHNLRQTKETEVSRDDG